MASVKKHAVIVLITLISSMLNLVSALFIVAKQNCVDRCGEVSIPFPFGTNEECYHSFDFFTTCNQTYNPPKLFWQNSSIEITDLSLDGQLTIMKLISKDCYNSDGVSTIDDKPNTVLPSSMAVSNTANKLTVVGCDTYGYVNGRRIGPGRYFRAGCIAWCNKKDDLTNGSCMGVGCCQTSIPDDIRVVNLTLSSFNNYTGVSDFDNCGYAFLVQESAFNFSVDSLSSLKNVEKLPMVVDWAIGNETCEKAKMNLSTYACESNRSECYEPKNGRGYRCSCSQGYEGNPYLTKGCQDINECEKGTHKCEKIDYCENTVGNFTCKCPKGYHGDGYASGTGCNRRKSLVFKLVTGNALGIIILILAAWGLHLELKRRRLVRMRKRFFLQNGGMLLQEKLPQRERSSSDTARIFSEDELKLATNDFHNSMIIGQGGFGTVYKGFLPDNRVVAIKKSKQVDPNLVDPKQVHEFVNEVMVLSQINHRNVVKFLGCCVETPVPLLVYEFVENGTLFEHLHNKARSRFLTWDIRLRIATESAGVLSYLHSSASPQIIHRDVKSANILLDHSFTAKVADFGASRLVPLDHTQLSTMVQGTLGYLDPEYMQTSQLTEKSDVYSFGVVLIELLTGMKPLSYDRPEKEQNLANLFLSAIKQDELFQVLDDSIVTERNKEELMRVALLAKSCLYVRGDDRPSMKEIVMELEGLRHQGKLHSWDRAGVHNVEEKESLLGFSGIIGREHTNNNITTDTFDSAQSNILFEEHHGR